MMIGGGCRRRRAGNELIWSLGWVPDVEYSELWVALERGYFADERVRLKYLPGGPNAPQPVVSVAAEQSDLGDGEWLPFLESVLQGNDFVILAARFPILPLGLLSLPRRPVRRPADLVGARFLVQGPSERTDLEAVFRLNHLPLDYQQIPVGYSPEPLLEGAGDAYFCYTTNQPHMLERMGMKRDRDFYVTGLYDLGYQVPSSLLFVRRALLEQKRPLLVGLLRALLRAQRANAQDPTYAARLVTEKYGGDLGLDYEQQLLLNREQVALQIGRGDHIPFWFSREQLEGMYRVAAMLGKQGLPAASRLVDLSLLEEAWAGLDAKGGA